MYCFKCGNEIQESAVFCSNCGQKVNESTIKDKKEEGQDVKELLVHFERLLNPIKEYEEKMKLISYYENQVKKRIEDYPKNQIMLLCGISIMIIFLIYKFIGILPNFLEKILNPVLAIAIVIYIVIFIVKIIPEVKKCELSGKVLEEVNSTKGKIELYKTEAEKIISLYRNEIIENIPEGYYNSYAVSEFITYIRSGQATKKKELVSIYENKMHQQRVENAQANMLNEQKQIKTLTAVTAAASVLSLFKSNGKSYWDE